MSNQAIPTQNMHTQKSADLHNGFTEKLLINVKQIPHSLRVCFLSLQKSYKKES